MDAETFEWQLQQLLKGWKIITLGEYIKLRRSGEKLPSYLVVLTIDDGYADFYKIAYPRLKKHGLRATFFPTINFVDKKIWLWPDRLRYALDHSPRKQFTIKLADETLHYNLTDTKERDRAWNQIADYCLIINDKRKLALILQIEKDLDIQLPTTPPPEYAAVDWDQLREMSENGIEIGSHTINHPILSRVEEKDLIEELAVSKKILEERLGKKVSSFCYPNSRPADINELVLKHVKKAGYTGAVHGFDPKITDLYRIPRVGVEKDKVDFLWKLCGMENLILVLKTRFAKPGSF
jgi:peptidoglycan/xylan/chitin deacetylase (PgdA/CDA1 family)